MKPEIVIIAGGLATRMQPISQEIPKCLIDVGGKPLIQHQIEFFRDKGYADFVFCVAHLADQVKQYFQDGSRFGVRIQYSQEPKELLGTAGAAKLVEGLVGDPCIIYYGDTITRMDFDALLAFHHAQKSDFTVVMRDNPPGYKGSSLITLNDRKEITHFIEQPSVELLAQNADKKKYINNGIYVMNKSVFARIPQGKKDFAKHLIPALLASGAKVTGYVCNDFFREIGRVEKYEHVQQEVKEKGGVL